MNLSFVLLALSMVLSMSLASASDTICPSDALTCAAGDLIGNLCYGACPDGYFATDAEATPVDDEVDGYFPGDMIYCWQNCHGNVYDTYYTQTCGKYSEYGVLSTMPSYAFADPNDTGLYSDQASCTADYPNGCELCSGQWAPLNDCGAPSCSEFCPVTCPSDMAQLDSMSCQRKSMKRPVIGQAQCPGASNPVTKKAKKTCKRR
jgi:hypothetical protein